jgi:ABC-type proline/glycine betaine transport system substrate-binding protein
MKYKAGDIVVVTLNSIKIKIIKEYHYENDYDYSNYEYSYNILNSIETHIVSSKWLDEYSELDKQYLRKEKLNKLYEI